MVARREGASDAASSHGSGGGVGAQADHPLAPLLQAGDRPPDPEVGAVPLELYKEYLAPLLASERN